MKFRLYCQHFWFRMSGFTWPYFFDIVGLFVPRDLIFLPATDNDTHDRNQLGNGMYENTCHTHQSRHSRRPDSSDLRPPSRPVVRS